MMPGPQADQETPMSHCWKAWNCNLYKFFTRDLKERWTRYFWVHSGHSEHTQNVRPLSSLKLVGNASSVLIGCSLETRQMGENQLGIGLVQNKHTFLVFSLLSMVKVNETTFKIN